MVRVQATTWAGPDQAERQIVDAALACIARVGVAKTTVDDVAAEAGCSRATLYRHVPGKRQLVSAVIRSELARITDVLDEVIAESDSLEDAIVAGIVVIASELERHDAVQFVLRNEPEIVLPHLSFAAADRVFIASAAIVGQRLERFLEPKQARRLAEWLARIVLSYSCNPSSELLLTNPDDVRRLVHDFVLPGVRINPQGGTES